MKFTIKFLSNIGSAISLDQKSIGLNHLNIARKNAVADFDCELLQSYIISINSDPLISITEEQAKLSGLFEDISHITVTCTPSILNDCVDEVLEVLRENGNDRINLVEFERVVNQVKLFEKWKLLGFPTIIQ